MQASRFAYRNHVLQTLAPSDLSELEPHLELVCLDVGQALEVATQPIDHVYFPESGLISVVSQGQGGKPLDTGMIGLEGLTGHALFLGHTHAPRDVCVRVAGQAYRMQAKPLALMLRQRSEMHCTMLEPVKTLIDQIAETARANALGKIDTRLARWILMAADRTRDKTLGFTHEFLSIALGVRRPGVTDAIHRLEGTHLIQSFRSRLIIRDRVGLEALTSGFYLTEERLKEVAQELPAAA